MEAWEEIFDRWMTGHEEEMTGDIQRLVQIPSVSGNQNGGCTRALKCMEELGKGYGFDTELHGDKCVSISFGTGRKEIGIWGHLDVVPEGKGWKYPPFACTQKEGFLIGRGVQDNKGPAVAVLYAFRFLKEEGISPVVHFRQILGVEEETGMEDAAYYIKHYKIPEYSFVADCAFPVCNGEKGILHITLQSSLLPKELEDITGGTVPNSVPEKARAVIAGKEYLGEGIGGHGAFPKGSRNAIGVLWGSIMERGEGFESPALALLGIFGNDGYGKAAGIACEDTVFGPLTCNLGVVRMNNRRIEAKLDIRYPMSVKGEEIKEKICRLGEAYGYRIKAFKDSPPFFVPPDNEFVKILTETYREYMSEGNFEPYTMGGGTYARMIPNAVGFGPGLPADFSALELPKGHGNCHGADEAQSVENLKRAVKIYVSGMMKINDYFKYQERQGKRKEEMTL